jgi:two-component system LytT family sensor kinase
MILAALVQAMSCLICVAYVYAKSPAFTPLRPGELPRRPIVLVGLFAFFTALSIAGTYLGPPVHGAIANTRAIGAVLAGVIGGPKLGLAVGFASGLHRWWLGGFTALACGLSTTTEGLIGGLVHRHFVRRHTPEQLFRPAVVLATTAVAEIVQMAIILAVARPFPDALELVELIAVPMVIANAVGAALFMSIIRDRRQMLDQVGAESAARALRIAERASSAMTRGLSPEVAAEVARIIHEETGVGAVSVTDTQSVLAFVGIGADHHQVGAAIRSELVRRAVAAHEVVFLDGVREAFRCPIHDDCPLTSALIVPLVVDGEVLGTIKLYEPANKAFLRINRTLGEGLSALFSTLVLRSRYQEQKSLLVMSELKLARAQVNPHFLFNALNTVMAMLPAGSQPRELLNHLANFFRKNLKRSGELATIEEELEHVRAYLEIEKARFEDRLSVELEIDPALLKVKVPTFTLQPLIENAVKHGISEMLGPGRATIRVYRDGDIVRIDVEDNAGAYEETKRTAAGLGLGLVDRRIRSLLGRGAHLEIRCLPNEWTRVSVHVPSAGAA